MATLIRYEPDAAESPSSRTLSGASGRPEPTRALGDEASRRQGCRHRRIPPRINLQRHRPRYYFEKMRKILSASLDRRLVEKMASDGGIAFKDLQSWTILLVDGLRGEKVRGPGAMQAAMHANNH